MPSRWVDVVRARVRALTGRKRLDQELDRELRAHLEHQVAENVALGMLPDEARRIALSTFGGVESVREESRDARGVAVVENIVRDLRYTLRALLREPMLLVAATLSIALGAGGNIAVISLARAFVFAPPDARDPGTLVTMRVSHGSHANYQRWLDLDASGGLERIAGYSVEKEVNWLDGDAASSVVPMVVTANFFDVTGVPVARGRSFTTAEARAELDPHVVVVSHEFWQRKLRGDSSIVGRTMTLNGELYAVLGVLPPRARSVAGFGLAPGIYVAVNRSLVPEMLKPNAAVVQLIGRLKPGQSLSEGRTAIDAIDRRLARLQGDTLYGGVQEFSRVGGFGTAKTQRLVGGFFALLGVVSVLVLLIACANVAGLLIARGTRRRQEIAIRLAIGGSRQRLLQQLLIEGFWLSLIGTLGGVALSVAFMRVVNSLSLPIPLPIELHLTADRTVFFGALAVVVLTVVSSALLPALHATRLTLVPALKQEEPFYASRRFTARGVLLTGQVTVSTVLLVTAFLFVRNLTRTQVTNPGFDAGRTVMAQIGFVQGADSTDHSPWLEEAVERVRSLPGVESAAYAATIPLTVHSGSSNGLTARIGSNAMGEHVQFARSVVGPGYFATMGVRVLAGREFTARDADGAPPVAIINEEFARRYFRGASPIGQHIQFAENQLAFDVVGVVANGKHRTLGEDQQAAIYLPVRQHGANLRIAFVVARTRNDPAPLVLPMRQALGELDRSVSIVVEPMESALQFAFLPSRIGAAVLGSLGLFGLVLAAFGLYAIVSYNVSRRIGEIAIRSALGASRGAILRLVVRDASVHVGVGLAVGLGIAMLVTAPLTTFLVAGLSATDPASFVGTAAVFLLVTVLASWLPARQASRINPAVAMRLD
jgi:putative ABC transport system permease protein